MKHSLLNATMRLGLLLILTIAGLQSFSQSNWTYKSPSPMGFNIFDASYVDANNGWAVGELGCIGKTTNGGLSWTYKSLPIYTGNGLTNFRPSLNQVQFVNTSVGYAVGANATIIKTTDGGTTWNYINGPLSPLSSAGIGINNLYFFDANNGWIIGDAINASSAYVYKTSNGGATWTVVPNIPVLNNAFYGIDFVDANNGYICGASGKVIRTSDGGATWTDISLTTTNYTVVGGGATTPRSQTYRSVIALDVNTAVISSQNNGCILRTTNGGTSWYASGNQGFGIPQMSTWQMARAGQDTIIVAGGQGRMAKSIDRGFSWTTQTNYSTSSIFYNQYLAINVIPGNPSKYVLMGQSGMMNITNNGGASWLDNYTSMGAYNGTCGPGNNAKNLFGISFVNSNYGMAVGAHGTLFTTNDGGTTWDDKSVGMFDNTNCSPDYIYGVRTPSITSSYICTANYGIIAKSTDFGFNWTTQYNAFGADGFYGMDFVDNNTGWVCSALGRVFKTTDGTNWNYLSTPPNSNALYAIDFIDANTGWVVGNQGKIYKTTNGGAVWTQQTSGITNALWSVQFLNANVGFACGASGRVLITTDGGTTWTQRNVTGIVGIINKVIFIDNLRGIVLINGGAAYVTTDAGLNWNPLYAPSAAILQDATFQPGTNKIAVVGGSLFGQYGDIFTLDYSVCTTSIITQPTNTAVCVGTVASFNVGTVGSLFNTYQWQLSTDNGVNYNDIPGATSSQYQFTTTGTESGYLYRCHVTNSCGSPTTLTTSAALLTFNSNPTITANPAANTTGCIGSPVTFTVGASGTGVTYQWQISTNNGVTFSNIGTGAVYLGTATNTLTIISVVATQNLNQFRCVVSGTCTPAANSTASILNIPVIITTQPLAVTQCAGGTANFSVVTAGVGVSYQWQVSTDAGVTYNNVTDGGVYSGTTTATLTITGTTAAMNGYLYRCVTANSPCTLNSSGALLTVNTAPAVVTQPVATTLVCVGQTVAISTTASGTALTYQWQLSIDGGTTYNNIVNGGVYSGATTASLTITGAIATMDGYKYKCVINGTCTPSTTTTVSTISISTPVAITVQPVNATVCANNTATFSVTATGTVLSYQWQVSVNGGATFTNITGANASSYTTTAANYLMNFTIYRCIIGSVCAGNITSGTALLTVNPNPIVAVAINPSGNMYPGLQSTISVTNVSPVAGVSYVWMKNGVVIPGATGASITVTVDDPGSYSVIVTDLNGCSSKSNDVLVSLLETPIMFIYPNPTSGKFHVRYYKNYGSANPNSIAIFDSKGSRIYSKIFPVNGPYEKMDVDLSFAPAGTYIVELMDFNGRKMAVGEVVIK
jgi:photosystem II stability/assembly factor-like uncharacterized protein